MFLYYCFSVFARPAQRLIKR